MTAIEPEVVEPETQAAGVPPEPPVWPFSGSPEDGDQPERPERITFMVQEVLLPDGQLRYFVPAAEGELPLIHAEAVRGDRDATIWLVRALIADHFDIPPRSFELYDGPIIDNR